MEQGVGRAALCRASGPGRGFGLLLGGKWEVPE